MLVGAALFLVAKGRRRHVSSPHQLVWLETPTNPTLKIIDIAAVCEMVNRKFEGKKVRIHEIFPFHLEYHSMKHMNKSLEYHSMRHGWE